MTKYTCPVCEYDGMDYPPEDYNICPCCGTEFGLGDVEWGVEALREEWIKGGRKWWSKYAPEPSDRNNK
jgi:hypothetical protein